MFSNPSNPGLAIPRRFVTEKSNAISVSNPGFVKSLLFATDKSNTGKDWQSIHNLRTSNEPYNVRKFPVKRLRSQKRAKTQRGPAGARLARSPVSCLTPLFAREEILIFAGSFEGLANLGFSDWSHKTWVWIARTNLSFVR